MPWLGEDVAQVAVAVARAHLGAEHAVAGVVLLHHALDLHGAGKAGPAAAAVELVQRAEQRFAGNDVDVQAGRGVRVVEIVERALGGGLLGDPVLLGCEPG